MSLQFDVVIVGAGLSGIGAACHLRKKCPDKTFAILEARSTLGGTWDLFRYPGIRSDSDMYTLGYQFKPWNKGKDIADGAAILSYIAEAAREYRVEEAIKYNCRVMEASWSSATAQWSLTVDVSGVLHTVKCRMLLLCTGYYDYESGHDPEIQGRDDFDGAIIHPQFWPQDLDYSNKRVVVVGSGATAVTLVPSMASAAKHVVMLQRSPTYIASLPSASRLSKMVRRLLPEAFAYHALRWFYIKRSLWFYRLARRFPRFFAEVLIRDVKRLVQSKADIEKDFRPRYEPWDQRLCFVPDGDLFRAIQSGKASVKTDTINRLVKGGIQLQSGNTLPADIIVTATGLKLKAMGGIKTSVDGKLVNAADLITYKGLMMSDVPNVVVTFGYVNASWTLRADLIADYFCRLVNEMDRRKVRQCTPRLRPQDHLMSTRPFIEHFTPGYIQRSLHLLPKQGPHYPWRYDQDYGLEKRMFRKNDWQDDVLVFDNPYTKVDFAEDS